MTAPETTSDIGETMYTWARDLFPICRSVTGDGVRRSIAYLRQRFPALTVHEIPSGTKAFDWTVPDEWNIRAAYIEDEAGRRIVDFASSNLHVMGYSEPVDIWLTLDELQTRLYSLPEQPDAVPWVASVYKRNWGFCMSETQRRALKPGRYHCVIDSTLGPGHLTYAEAILPGREKREVLITTYLDHPSLANNELSGPVVATALGQWLSERTDRRFTYRIVFAPETIGSIVYLSRHGGALKERLAAGFVLTCIGDERTYSVVHTPYEDTIADRVARHVLRHHAGEYKSYSFLQRGSDERQYCSPGFRLPVVTLMRSKFGEYPEYHTSLDDLSVISPAGLKGGLDLVRRCIETLEGNDMYRMTVLCEPQLGRRGLYPTTMRGSSGLAARGLTNLIAYLDGREDLLGVCDRIGLPLWEAQPLIRRLLEEGLAELVG